MLWCSSGEEMEKSCKMVSQNCPGTECDSEWSRCQSCLPVVLTCFPSASGLWNSLVYRHSRCPLLYTKAPRPQPAHPGWFQQYSCHLKKCDIMRSKVLRGVLICWKQSKILTNFHHLWSAFWEPSVIPGSAIILPGVLLSDNTEFLRAINYNDLSCWIFVQWSKRVPMRANGAIVIHVYYPSKLEVSSLVNKSMEYSSRSLRTVNQQMLQTLSP